MEFLRQAAARLRATIKSPLMSLPVLSLSLPAASPMTALSTPLQPSATASRYDLVGSGVTAISVASYNANDPIEDRWSVVPSTSSAEFKACNIPGSYVFASVMDGHGGWQAAEFTKSNLAQLVWKEMSNSADISDPRQISQALSRAFSRTDRAFIDSIRGAFQLGFGDVAKVGCCTLAALICKDWVVVANSGDCRAVLGHVSWTKPEGSLLQAANEEVEEGNLATVKEESLSKREADPNVESLYVTALPLSNDHNARIPREVARLKAAHPGEHDIVVCKSPGVCYVKGRLQPTRAIGDAYLKHSEFNATNANRLWGRHIPPPYTPPYITSTPETKILWLANKPNASPVYTDPVLDITTKQRELPDRHTFIILASDGVWDVLSNHEAVAFVAEDDGDAESVASRLLQHVLRREAAASGMDVAQLMALQPGRRRRSHHDDLTAVVLFLGEEKSRNAEQKKGWFQ